MILMRILLFLSLFISTEFLSAQPFDEQIRWEDRTRRFITFLPQDYSPEESLPLVINMHPFLTDGPFQMRYTQFNWLADTSDVIVVYPYGIRGRWNSGSFFGVGHNVDDVGFLNALIDYMAVLYNIDTRRVYATGYSAGGYMSYRLACDLTNRIAAIAPVAASMNPDLVPMCNPDRPVPVMALNGTADALVAYNGFFGAEGVEDVMELWRSLNGCDPDPTIVDVPDIAINDGTTSDRYSWNNCEDGSEVILYKILNGGHTWPGRNFPLLGNTSQDIIANVEIWDFFKRHQIPEAIACDRPTGLFADYDGEIVSLNWDAVDGIDFYSLLYILPEGELELVENVAGNQFSLAAPEGELAWMVRAQCESGHISWSTANLDDISARISSGRISLVTYPNPASDRLFVDLFDSPLTEEIAIVNAMGRVVRTIAVEGKEMTLDISDLPPGLYHVISSGAGKAHSTFRKF